MSGTLFRAPRLEAAIERANLAAAASARVADELDLLDALASQEEAVAGRAMWAAGLRGAGVRLERRSAGGRPLDAVVRSAEDFAAADGSIVVATEHVLCVLLTSGSASSSQVQSAGVDPRLIRSQAATEASEAGRPVEAAEIRQRAAGTAVAWHELPAIACEERSMSASAHAAAALADVEAILGVAVVTVAAGVVDIATHGFADALLRTPLSDDSPFRIGSLTKVLTAVTALALAERELIDLDVPVGKYLTSLRVQPAPGPTLRQLLAHVGGTPSGAWLHSPGAIAPSFVDAVNGVVELSSSPGERWEYSNIGYSVIGQVLEETVGASFPTVVRDAVLAPLGMASTTIEATRVAELPEGYWIDKGELVATPRRDIIMRAAGGALSTPSDIARLLAFLAAPSATATAPVSEHGVAAMLRPQVQAGPAAGSHGLAFRLRESNGRHIGWHPGRISGFPSSMCVAAGAGSAVMLNTESLSAAPVASAALDDAIAGRSQGGHG